MNFCTKEIEFWTSMGKIVAAVDINDRVVMVEK